MVLRKLLDEIKELDKRIGKIDGDEAFLKLTTRRSMALKEIINIANRQETKRTQVGYMDYGKVIDTLREVFESLPINREIADKALANFSSKIFDVD